MSGKVIIKICGLTRKEDLRVCQDLGIDLTGFIFHASSPRYVSPEVVGAWPKLSELRVGVFVRASTLEVLEAVQVAGLDLVQLHGGQDRLFCRRVGTERVIRVFWPERFECKADFERELCAFQDFCRYFLFDAGRSLGGHGRKIQCSWLAEVKSPMPFLLAGGLAPDNLDHALEFSPRGVDLNSGVESSPGHKDPEKIRNVVKQLRGIE